MEHRSNQSSSQMSHQQNEEKPQWFLPPFGNPAESFVRGSSKKRRPAADATDRDAEERSFRKLSIKGRPRLLTLSDRARFRDSPFRLKTKARVIILSSTKEEASSKISGKPRIAANFRRALPVLTASLMSAARVSAAEIPRPEAAERRIKAE